MRLALVDDHFDNGRTPEEYKRSAWGSFLNVYADQGDAIVDNARILSDGVCNAYLVDVWTRSDLRRRGVGRAMVKRLLLACEGQHVYLTTSDMDDFYAALGFEFEFSGMSQVVGSWLSR